jgi:hypothetical protein
MLVVARSDALEANARAACSVVEIYRRVIGAGHVVRLGRVNTRHLLHDAEYAAAACSAAWARTYGARHTSKRRTSNSRSSVRCVACITFVPWHSLHSSIGSGHVRKASRSAFTRCVIVEGQRARVDAARSVRHYMVVFVERVRAGAQRFLCEGGRHESPQRERRRRPAILARNATARACRQ